MSTPSDERARRLFPPGPTWNPFTVARVAAAIRAAVLEEREACARETERPDTTRDQLAANIRGRPPP